MILEDKMDSMLEEYEPCFFESGGGEPPGIYDAPVPSEDIWKKFELLPTPPRSPQHMPSFDSLDSPTSTLDKLRLVSDLLDDPICKTVIFPDLGFSAKCTDNCCNFNSKLIHDCMWSGSNIPIEFTMGAKNMDSSNRHRSCSISSNSDGSSLCVDPNVTAVFPYPVSAQKKRSSSPSPSPSTPSSATTSLKTSIIKPEVSKINTSFSLGTETPSESESESESEDEEDEEIDVVTVASSDRHQSTTVPTALSSLSSRQSTQRHFKPVTVTPTSAASQVAAMHNYTATPPRSPKSDSRQSHSHNSPKRSHHSGNKRSSHHLDHSTPLKRAKISVAHSSELRSVIRRYKQGVHGHHKSGHSRGSSDSEDSDCKRAQHNVLERKRRNDLKYSFHNLRDCVPELENQERAAKVTILKKATDHIIALRKQDRMLSVELDRQQRTHEALLRRLRMLKHQQ